MTSVFDAVLEQKFFYLYWKDDRKYYLVNVFDVEGEEPDREFWIHFYGFAKGNDVTMPEQVLRHPTGKHQPLEYTLDNFHKIFALSNHNHSLRQLGAFKKNDGTYELNAKTTAVKTPRSLSKGRPPGSAASKKSASKSKAKSTPSAKECPPTTRSSTRIRKRMEESQALNTSTPRRPRRLSLRARQAAIAYAETAGDLSLPSPTDNVSEDEVESEVLSESSDARKTTVEEEMREAEDTRPTPSKTPKRKMPVRKRKLVAITDDTDLDLNVASVTTPASVSKKPAKLTKKKGIRGKPTTPAVIGPEVAEPQEVEMQPVVDEEPERTADVAKESADDGSSLRQTSHVAPEKTASVSTPASVSKKPAKLTKKKGPRGKPTTPAVIVPEVAEPQKVEMQPVVDEEPEKTADVAKESANDGSSRRQTLPVAPEIEPEKTASVTTPASVSKKPAKLTKKKIIREKPTTPAVAGPEVAEPEDVEMPPVVMTAPVVGEEPKKTAGVAKESADDASLLRQTLPVESEKTASVTTPASVSKKPAKLTKKKGIREKPTTPAQPEEVEMQPVVLAVPVVEEKPGMMAPVEQELADDESPIRQTSPIAPEIEPEPSASTPASVSKKPAKLTKKKSSREKPATPAVTPEVSEPLEAECEMPPVVMTALAVEEEPEKTADVAKESADDGSSLRQTSLVAPEIEPEKAVGIFLPEVAVTDDTNLDLDVASASTPASVSKKPAELTTKKIIHEKPTMPAVAGLEVAEPEEVEMRPVVLAAPVVDDEPEKTADVAMESVDDGSSLRQTPVAPEIEPEKTAVVDFEEPTETPSVTDTAPIATDVYEAVVGGQEQAVVVAEQDNESNTVYEANPESAVSASDQEAVFVQDVTKQKETVDEPMIPPVNVSESAQPQDIEEPFPRESLPTAEKEEQIQYFVEEPTELPPIAATLPTAVEEVQMMDYVDVEETQETSAVQGQGAVTENNSVVGNSNAPIPDFAASSFSALTDQNAGGELAVLTFNGTEGAESHAATASGDQRSKVAAQESTKTKQGPQQKLPKQVYRPRLSKLPAVLKPPQTVGQVVRGPSLVAVRPLPAKTPLGNNKRTRQAILNCSPADGWLSPPSASRALDMPGPSTVQRFPVGASWGLSLEHRYEPESYFERFEFGERYKAVPRKVCLEKGSLETRQNMQYPQQIEDFINADIDRCNRYPDFVSCGAVTFRQRLEAFFTAFNYKPYYEHYATVFSFFNLNGTVLFTPAELEQFKSVRTAPGQMTRDHAIGWMHHSEKTNKTTYLLDLLNLVHVFRMLDSAHRFIDHNRRHGGLLPKHCDAMEFFRDFANYMNVYCQNDRLTPSNFLMMTTPLQSPQQCSIGGFSDIPALCEY